MTEEEMIINNRYKITEIISESGGNKEYKGYDMEKNLEIAIKEFDLDYIDKEEEVKTYNIMKEIDSPYSRKCYDIIETTDNLYIILEYCDGVLIDMIKTIQKGPKMDYIKQLLNQIYELYKVLYKKNIFVRELDPKKIFIKYKEDKDKKSTNSSEIDFDIKISDYSKSKNIQKFDTTQTVIGSSILVAPEISFNLVYTNECDLWCIGILAYLLYYGKLPKKNQKIEIKIAESPELEDLIKNLLVSCPDARLSWEQFFEHAYFGKIKKLKKKDLDEVLKKYTNPYKYQFQFEIYENDKLYIGEVIKGTKIYCGRGMMINEDGSIYKGVFFNTMNGKGELISKNGDIYEGEFKNGLKHGKGKEIYKNGDKYEGEFVNNYYCGYGELKEKNGNEYKGQFLNGQKYGKGTYYDKKTGDTFDGNWKNNEKDGEGTIYLDEGGKEKGIWKNGEKISDK